MSAKLTQTSKKSYSVRPNLEPLLPGQTYLRKQGEECPKFTLDDRGDYRVD